MSWVYGKPHTYGQNEKERNSMHFTKILFAQHEFHYIEMGSKETCTRSCEKMFAYLFARCLMCSG